MREEIPPRVEVARRIAVCDEVLLGALAADDTLVTEEVAHAAWKRHSDRREAEWLALYPKDDDNRRALLPHLEVED